MFYGIQYIRQVIAYLTTFNDQHMQRGKQCKGSPVKQRMSAWEKASVANAGKLM